MTSPGISRLALISRGRARRARAHSVQIAAFPSLYLIVVGVEMMTVRPRRNPTGLGNAKTWEVEVMHRSLPLLTHC